MEKICKKCGRTFPLEMFPKSGVYYRNTCKYCTNDAKREWEKRHGRSDETKAKDVLRCALKREQMKCDTGLSYRNPKERENRNAYAKKYESEHKDDPRFIETKRKCGRNYRERCKVREDVAMLSEFFSDDLSF